jgi:hypothetical protein
MLLFSDVKMNVGETYMCMSTGSEILVHFAEKIRFHTASCFATSFSHFLHRLCGTAYQVKQLVWTVMQQRL